MIIFNTFRTIPASFAFNNKNSVAFTGIKEEIDEIVDTATKSNSPVQIHGEIEDLRDIYIKKDPSLVENALKDIIQFHENPNNPLRGGSEGIIKRCNSILDDIKKIKI